jgi:hypothetical protein
MAPRGRIKNGVGAVGQQDVWPVEAGDSSVALTHVAAGDGVRQVGVQLLGRPGEKENRLGRRGIVKCFIYSNNFQICLNCFDPKVDLPSSKYFKKNMYLKGIKQEATFLIGTFQNSRWNLN